MEAAATNAKAFAINWGAERSAGGRTTCSSGFVETAGPFGDTAVTPSGGAGFGAGAGVGTTAMPQTRTSVSSGGWSPVGGDVLMSTVASGVWRDTSVRGKRPRADSPALAGCDADSQARNVVRRLSTAACVPKMTRLASTDGLASEEDGPATTTTPGFGGARAPPQVLVQRRRLRPVLKSHSACTVTGRGAVPRVRKASSGAIESGATPCSTPGGNTHSPRLYADGARGHTVRFAKTAKTHDGLRKDNEVFDQLITRFFGRDVQGCHTLVAAHTARDPLMPRRLVVLCHDLAERIVASGSGTAAVLPRGGGSVSRLGHAHMQSLLLLQGMLTEASFAAAALSSRVTPRSRVRVVAKAAPAPADEDLAGGYESDNSFDSFDMSCLSNDEDDLQAFDWTHVADLASRAGTPVPAR